MRPFAWAGTVAAGFCDGGVDLDTLAEATRPVAEAFDAADAVSGPYNLELSSPGVERSVWSQEADPPLYSPLLTMATRGRSAGRRTGMFVSLLP